MIRKFFLILLFGGLLALFYYLFLRPYQYEVNFKAKTLPGDIIETVRIWSRSLDSSTVVHVDSFNSLDQAIAKEGRHYNYKWRFLRVNDSITKVNIQISQPEKALLNKILIPFTERDIEKDAAEIVRQFFDVLKGHLEITRVNLLGEAELDSVFCLCSEVETRQIEKANGMMKDYSLLTSFIATFGLNTDGPPMVRVREWSHSRGTLKFDFCFPILPSDTLPSADMFVYRRFPAQQAIRAEYFGNYITSDRGWYALLDYAKEKGYQINGLPVEYFHNNPNLGINEHEWKAEIFLPIK